MLKINNFSKNYCIFIQLVVQYQRNKIKGSMPKSLEDYKNGKERH